MHSQNKELYVLLVEDWRVVGGCGITYSQFNLLIPGFPEMPPESELAFRKIMKFNAHLKRLSRRSRDPGGIHAHRPPERLSRHTGSLTILLAIP